jgi:hypothetical protein
VATSARRGLRGGGDLPVTWTVVPAGDGAAPDEGTVELEPGSGVVSFGVEVLEPGEPRERRWEHRIPYRVQDGEVELLRPGTGWALTGTRRLRWVEDHVGNPVQEH